MSANYWETKQQWCRSLWHHEEWSPRRPASSHACARCSKIEASRPCSQPSPQRAACYHSALLPQGLACWGSLSSPIIWDPSIARRLNPSLFLHQHKASSVTGRGMKEVCMLPATHMLSKFTARQSLLFVLMPPSHPAIHVLRDSTSSKWRPEREESKQERGKNIEGRGVGNSTESGPRLSPIVQVTTH